MADGKSIVTDPYRVREAIGGYYVDGPGVDPIGAISKRKAESHARQWNREHRERNNIPQNAPGPYYTYPDDKETV